MRIHRLEIQAFGPFAERQIIDFDALGEQGLFLLNGATGAGKTSVLDAISYALYGTVPGARQSGKRLRSDHAPEGLEPQVVCEFSARGRWMEVVRSPAWERPTKRGSGSTTQQAKTLLRERENGVWLEKSARNDEAGGEITALLGMNMDQFTKVVLLAQGDFAAFLRAKADDRQELLQKLFGTELYENVEKQLVTEAAAAKEELAAKEAQLWQLEMAARAQAGEPAAPAGAADAGLNAGPATGQDAGPLGTAEDEARGDRLFDLLLERLAGAYMQAQTAAVDRQQERLESAENLLRAEELMSRHQKLRAAVAERERLAGLRPQFEQWQQRAQEHREAEVLAGQLAGVTASQERLASAETTAGRIRERLAADTQAMALAGLTGGTGGLSVADLKGAQSRLDREGAVVEALL
ncbi:MAG TPA: SMC family ATPase, partial [Micrococcaceae bacterium]